MDATEQGSRGDEGHIQMADGHFLPPPSHTKPSLKVAAIKNAYIQPVLKKGKGGSLVHSVKRELRARMKMS